MRIAIDVRSLMEGRHSGVEEYTTQIIRAMVRAAPDHEYHLFYNSAKQVSLPDLGEAVALHGFRYPNKAFNTMQFALNWPHWDSLVRADCFFVPNFRLMPLSRNIPVVTTVHDLSFERFPELFSWRRRVWHKLMRPRVLVKNSDQVIAVSQATKEDVVDIYGIEEKDVLVVYSGISGEVGELSEEEPFKVKVKKKYQLPDKYVLFLGTFEPRKKVSNIILAFDAIADKVSHDLVLAGEKGWLMGEIKRALSVVKNRQRIHVLGYVPPQDKRALYSQADLFVYPSIYEGFGFPPLEALLSGTPVITSCNSSLPEVVGEWATLVEPDDAAELALTMKELLNDLPDVPERVGREIVKKYSWDRAARETLKVLESVV